MPGFDVDVETLAPGLELLNRGEFFEAHEALEDVWRAAPAPEKKFLQGLVQIAVAFHHHSTGNRIGMRSVMERAARNLSEAPVKVEWIELTPLLDCLAGWQTAIDNGTTPPALPKVTRRRS